MQSLPDLSQLSHAQKDEIIRMLWARLQELTPQMKALQERIEQLEGRLAQNSKNSSKPPSSDGYGKVDQTVSHQGPTHCSACQLELHQHQVAETRQVLELPELVEKLA